MIAAISEIINDFDPLDLMPFAPQDEYDIEVKEIYNFIQNNSHCDADTLARQIYTVFLNNSGAEALTKNMQEYKAAAKKILLKI